MPAALACEIFAAENTHGGVDGFSAPGIDKLRGHCYNKSPFLYLKRGYSAVFRRGS